MDTTIIMLNRTKKQEPHAQLSLVVTCEIPFLLFIAILTVTQIVYVVKRVVGRAIEFEAYIPDRLHVGPFLYTPFAGVRQYVRTRIVQVWIYRRLQVMRQIVRV